MNMTTRKTIISIASLLLISWTLSCTSHYKITNTSTVWHSASAWSDRTIWDENKIDVFYITSTNVLSEKDNEGKELWYATINEEQKKLYDIEIEWIANTTFYDDFNVIAPYYHQFTFNAITSCPNDSLKKIRDNVAREVCEAFDYYMQHINNDRPFIIAGFSQGAMLTLDLLRHMTDEQYSRMIASYTIGYRLSDEDLKHPHIKAASKEDDKGVVISFNSVLSNDAIWDLIANDAATCINPINWKTDNTPAIFTDHGIENTIHIDTTTNVLIVNSENPEYYEQQMSQKTFYAKAGVSNRNLHNWDIIFYGKHIHDNALKRAQQ